MECRDKEGVVGMDFGWGGGGRETGEGKEGRERGGIAGAWERGNGERKGGRGKWGGKIGGGQGCKVCGVCSKRQSWQGGVSVRDSESLGQQES